MAEVMLTKDNFEAEVLKSDIPVLVDFWAPWCGPCKMAGPIISEIAEEYEGKYKVGKVNVDQEPWLAQKYGVMSIPYFAFIKKGNLYDDEMGAVSKERLVKKIEEMV